MGFIFGGDTGTTAEQLARRREVANAMRNRALTSTPRNVGEGIASIGQALAARNLDKKLSGPENAERAKIAELLAGRSSNAAAPDTSNMLPFRNAIASIESDGSGGYDAVGPTHDTMGRALGRYQIMEANLPEWSQAAVGREVTADEFMASPQIQDAIFDHRFGGYVDQYGPEQAAQAWFAGPGGIGKMDRQDSLGTSVADYTRKFNEAMGGGANGGSANLADYISILNNPYASDAQKQVASVLVSRRLAPKPAPTKGVVINGQLVDPVTGDMIGDYRDAEPEPRREIRTGPNGIERYVDTGEPVFPNVEKDTAPGLGESFDLERKLRTEFNGLPQVKDFASIQDSFARIRSLDESAAGDMALIFNYMKLLDPGSVVRESEFATAEQAGAWLQSASADGIRVPRPIASAIRKAQTGQKLSPEQRKDFISQAGNLFNAQLANYNGQVERYRQLAEVYGVSAGNIAELAEAFQSPEPVLPPTEAGNDGRQGSAYLAPPGDAIQSQSPQMDRPVGSASRQSGRSGPRVSTSSSSSVPEIEGNRFSGMDVTEFLLMDSDQIPANQISEYIKALEALNQ